MRSSAPAPSRFARLSGKTRPNLPSHGHEPARRRVLFTADAHRDNGKRFVVTADEKLTAFLELERVTLSRCNVWYLSFPNRCDQKVTNKCVCLISPPHYE